MKRGRGLTLLGLLLGLLVVSAGLSLIYRVDGSPSLYPATGPHPITVYVVNNGFHTDLVLPRHELTVGQGPLGLVADQGAAGQAWVYLGWGDARFFVEEGPIEKRWADGLRALFRPGNASVLMVRGGPDPETYYAKEARQRLTLTRAGYGRLVAQIESQMVTTPEGEAALSVVRASDGVRFYRHSQGFWLGRLCNHWTLDGLRAAGLTVWPWRPMTAGEVMRQARLNARRAEAARLDLQAQAH